MSVSNLHHQEEGRSSPMGVRLPQIEQTNFTKAIPNAKDL